MLEPRSLRRQSIAGWREFVAAAVLGTIHASFTVYWAFGGTWLVWSLGTRLLETFGEQRWLLLPVGGVKIIAAVAPLMLAFLGWPARRVTRGASWLSAVVLIVWGGVNTLVGNLVLAGVIQPDSGYDSPGMMGHAYLWDPLFLAWGIARVLGLFAARRST